MDKLLAEFAALMNKYGPDSQEAKNFLQEHNDNTNFIELAKVSQDLKRAFAEKPFWLGTNSYKIGNTKIVKVSKDMVAAFQNDLDCYHPAFDRQWLLDEGGISENSYKNLVYLISKIGTPMKVERRANGNVLVHFSEDKFYLATGFEVGYLGSGPFHFARFAERAGFGECDDLYMKISGMSRDYVGVVFEKK